MPIIKKIVGSKKIKIVYTMLKGNHASAQFRCATRSNFAYLMKKLLNLAQWSYYY